MDVKEMFITRHPADNLIKKALPSEVPQTLKPIN